MLDGMIKTDLDIIKSESGLVLHALKHTDLGFKKFGEVYFSTVAKDNIKAWKLHQQMTLNLVVPVGSVLSCFLDIRKKSSTCNETCKIILSQKPYFRLMVPPGIWFGFKGVSSGLNLLCNVADMPHDPNEIMRKKMDEIEMDWSLESKL
jgi:dTDP-4-dehydrorhamnose 3,5-epimerase